MNLRLWICLIAICLVPRLVGAIVNREANDDHIEVVQIWMDQGRYPHESQCWECFQPPLYSALQFYVAQWLGLTDRQELIVSAQLINFIFAGLTLGLLAAQIQAYSLRARWKVLLFLFVALNPKLVAIQIQASNDTLVIFFGTALIYVFNNVSSRMHMVSLASAWVIMLFAAICKGNGLVLLACGCVEVTAVIVLNKSLAKSRAWLLALFLLCLPLTAFEIGLYGERFLHTGSAFSINQPKAPPANLIEFDEFDGKRLGVRSVVDCYLTFRIVDLVKSPYLTNGLAAEPVHRTSFWTLLYGQSVHAQYEQYPPSWQSTSAAVVWTARYLILLGLLPMGLLIYGAAVESNRFWQAVYERNWLLCRQRSVSLLFAIGYILFLIKYSFDYRDFATIKLIFVMPAISVAVDFLATAVMRLRGARFEPWVFYVLGLMVMGFLCNVLLLLMTILNYSE